MGKTVREYLMVTLVAMLIWLYAEGENIKPYELDLQIHFVAAGKRQLLIRSDEPTPSIKVKVRCNQSQLAQLKQIASGPLEIPVTEPADPNVIQQQILLQPRLAALPQLANLGVTITETLPSQLTVSIRRMEQIKLNILATAEGDTQLKDVVIEPAEAVVHLPANQLQNISASDHIIAHLSADMIASLPINQSHTLSNVALLPPEAVRTANVRVEPLSAKVTFTITRQTREAVISTVAVRMILPAATTERYDVTLVNQEDQLLHGVKIVGPHDLIEQIIQRKIKIWADLRLESDQLAKNADKEALDIVPHIEKPDQVKLVEQPHAIKVRITKR